MSSAPSSKRRSFGLRLALLTGVTSFVTSCALMLAAGWIATDAIYDALGDDLAAESAELSALAGDKAVSEAIEQRETARRGRFLYLLRSTSGERLAGSLPNDDLYAPGLSNMDWPGAAPQIADAAHDDEFESLIAYRKGLPGGATLIVGADGESLVEAREAMWEAAGWGIPFAVLAGLAAAAAVGARYRRRVEDVSACADAIMGDQLTLRMPVNGSGDEIDRLSLALNAMLDRLAHSMEGLRQISNDIAHELRTPLSRLQQSLETAQTLGDRGAMSRAVEDAASEARNLLAVFAALLRIAQLEGGALREGFATVDLSQTLNQIFEVYLPVAEDDGRTLVAKITPGLLVQGDRELLLQMFANLVENALRHTPQRSSVTLALDREDDRIVAVVRDDGPGIPADQRKNVAKRFVRLDVSRTSGGSGLGLALVSAIAEAHDALMVLSDANPGLKVSLSFSPLESFWPKVADPARAAL